MLWHAQSLQQRIDFLKSFTIAVCHSNEDQMPPTRSRSLQHNLVVLIWSDGDGLPAPEQMLVKACCEAIGKIPTQPSLEAGSTSSCRPRLDPVWRKGHRQQTKSHNSTVLSGLISRCFFTFQVLFSLLHPYDEDTSMSLAGPKAQSCPRSCSANTAHLCQSRWSQQLKWLKGELSSRDGMPVKRWKTSVIYTSTL